MAWGKQRGAPATRRCALCCACSEQPYLGVGRRARVRCVAQPTREISWRNQLLPSSKPAPQGMRLAQASPAPQNSPHAPTSSSMDTFGACAGEEHPAVPPPTPPPLPPAAVWPLPGSLLYGASAGPSAAGSAPCPTLFDLPEPLQDVISGLLGLGDLAAAICASRSLQALCQRALGLKRSIEADADLRLLPRQHNFLLLGAGAGGSSTSSSSSNSSSSSSGSVASRGSGAKSSGSGSGSSGSAEEVVSGGITSGGSVASEDGASEVADGGSSSAIGGSAGSSSSREAGDGDCWASGGGGGGSGDRLRRRVLSYVPAALHYASQHCRALQRVHLELPPPQVPLSAAADAVARAVAGEPWQPAPAAWAGAGDNECTPVDGHLLKLLAQACPDLRSLRLVNVTNNATMNRLVRPNDSCLAVLAGSCPLLEELVIGHRGGEECMFNPAAPFYLEEVGDAGLRAVAQHCSRLRHLGLLRCSRVGDDGLSMIARRCRQLTALTLHDCPGISERSLIEVGERCTNLRALDCTAARRTSGLLMIGEDADQLGFLALFTIAANCPNLEDLCLSEEGLEAPVVDEDCILCLAQGCRRLRRLVLRHCGAVTDAAVRAVATRCKLLQELVLEHTALSDVGVLHAVRALPLLRTLCLANYATSLGHLAFQPGGQPAAVSGVSDAALQHIAEHCTGLRQLAITGSRRATDAGLLRLALRPRLAAHLTSLTINHTAATDGSVGQLLARCGELRALSLRGLLFNADATVAGLVGSCRHLTSLDLRHCSTLSDAGLEHLSRLRWLRVLHLSFCVRITDNGLCLLASLGPPPAAADAAAASREPHYYPATASARSNGSSSGSASEFACSRAGGASLSGGWCGASGSVVFDVRRSGAAAIGSSATGHGPAAMSEEGAEAGEMPPGWLARASSSSSSSGTGTGTGTGSSSLLQELELYHVPQVTHRGILALAGACPNLVHVNIGKCRLVWADSLRSLLDRRALRLSACHYLDS